MTEKRLDEKVALIAGAGNGMGRASAYLFTAEGAKVVVCTRREIRVCSDQLWQSLLVKPQGQVVTPSDDLIVIE